MFANIDSVLDKIKSIPTSYRLQTLYLYIKDCFCHILEYIVCKNVLLNSKLFKTEISLNITRKIPKDIPKNIWD